MKTVHRLATLRPGWTWVALLLVWCALAPGLGRLEIATDGRALLDPRAPAVAIDREIRSEFGIGDELALIVSTRAPEGIWNAATLARVAELTRALAEVDGVERATIKSLSTEPGDTVRPGTLDTVPWLTPLPESAGEVESLARRVERVDLYRGTLISVEDPPSSTAIVFRIEGNVDRRAACERIESWVDARSSDERELVLVGAPLAESRLGDHLLRDLALLVPCAFVLMGLVLYLSFRSVWAVLLPLANVGLALGATFAVMGWCGARVYLTVLVLPIVLTVVGVASAVHLLDDYVVGVRARPERARAEVLLDSLSRLWPALLSAELTTAIGFLSFALSPLPPMRTFGLFATLGVGFYVIGSQLALPAAIALLDRAGWLTTSAARSRGFHDRLANACRAIAIWSIERRSGVVLGSGALIAAFALGISRVRVQDSWLDGFSRTSQTWRDTARVDGAFGGTHILRLRVDAHAEPWRGRVARADFDERAVSLAIDEQSARDAVRWTSLSVTPLGLGAGDRRAAPIDLAIVGRERRDGRLHLTLAHRALVAVDAADLLPAGVEQFDCELSSRGALTTPKAFVLLGRLEDLARSAEDLGVGKVLGPRSHLEALSQVLRADPAAHARALTTQTGIAHVLGLYRTGRGEARMREVWNQAEDRVLLTLLVRGANFVAMGTLLERLRVFERAEIAPLALDLGGDIALSQPMIDGIVRTQQSSLAGSVLLIVLATVLFTRSLVRGILCAVPCSIAIAGALAWMGWSDIPLGIATSMFAAVTLGVGVDYAVHVTRAVSSRPDEPPADAIARAFARVGPAVIVDALAVGLGFGVLMFSSVPPNARLGVLLAASIAGCLVATLVLLPALLALAPVPRRGTSVDPVEHAA